MQPFFGLPRKKMILKSQKKMGGNKLIPKNTCDPWGKRFIPKKRKEQKIDSSIPGNCSQNFPQIVPEVLLNLFYLDE